MEGKKEIPTIDRETFQEGFTMQDVQNAVNILSEYATLLDGYLNEKQEKGGLFLDLLEISKFIDGANVIDNLWDEWLGAGTAFLTFGFTEKDLDAFHEKRTKAEES